MYLLCLRKRYPFHINWNNQESKYGMVAHTSVIRMVTFNCPYWFLLIFTDQFFIVAKITSLDHLIGQFYVWDRIPKAFNKIQEFNIQVVMQRREVGTRSIDHQIWTRSCLGVQWLTDPMLCEKKCVHFKMPNSGFFS